MVRDGDGWSRVVVPEEEASISVRLFDPVTGTYRSDKYLVGADVADQARTLRTSLKWAGCTADPQRLAELGRLQGNIANLLPPQPNERLVYHCGAGSATATPPPPKDAQ